MEKIKRAKGISIVLLFMMVLQLMMPVNFAYGDTTDTDSGDDSGGNVILSGTTSGAAIKAIDIKLQFRDSSNNIINHEINPVPADASVKLTVQLDFIDIMDTEDPSDPGKIDTSKIYTIKIADQMSISENKVIDIYHPMETTEKIATATIKTNGTIDIEFLPSINEFDKDRFLWVEADGKMDKSKLGSGGDQELEFEVLGKTEKVSIEFVPIEEKIILTKTGSWNTSENKITWTIEAKAETKPIGGTVKNVVIKDTLGADQTFNSHNLGSGVTYNSETGNYEFGDIAHGQKKTLTIVTVPDLSAFKAGNENNEVKLYNTVGGTFGNNTEISEITAEVETTVNFIDKKDGQFIPGTTRAEDIISWTVEINNNNLVMPNGTKLTDTIPSGLELIEDSIKINGNPISSFSGAVFDNTAPNFSIEFSNGLTKKAVITYNTKVTNPNHYNPGSLGSYTNNATLTWGVGNSLSDNGTAGITNTVIAKSGTGIDVTDNRHVKWLIKVNESRLNIQDPEVVDTLPVELEYVSSTYPLGWTVTTGTALSGGNTVQTVTFKFSGNTSEQHNISVITKVKDGYKDIYGANISKKFTNNVSLEGTNIGKTSTSSDQYYVSEVIKKINEGYDYFTRVASWKIVVNQNNMTVNDAIITDTIGDYHEYVENSLVLVGGVLTKVEGEPLPGEYSVIGKIIKINLGNITGEKTITYNTKIPDTELENIFGKNSKSGEPKISNTAKIDGDTIKPEGQSVTVGKEIKNTLVSKNATRGNQDDYIEWSVEVNLNQLNFGESDVKLEDELQNELILDKNSVRLYKLNMDANGSYSMADAVLVSDKVEIDYNVVTNKVVFDLGKINGEAYLLKFVTDIDGDKASNLSISNTITLIGTSKIGDSAKKDLNVSFDNSTGGGGGSKTKGSIKIIKEDDYGNTLSGVRFELYNKDKQPFNPAKIATTDGSGVAYFDDLSIATYWVKELEAPDGYVLLDEYKNVVLKKGYVNGIDQKNQEVTIQNTKIVNDQIKVIKIDASENVLPGTLFGIYAKNTPTTLIKSELSGFDGVVLFENMPAGEYLIKEITSLAGYLKSSAVIYVKAEKYTENNLQVTYSKDDVTYSAEVPKFVNTSIDIEFIKENDRGVMLPGAEFTLFDSSENNVGESVLSKSTIAEGSNGNVVFKKVAPGKYTVRETQIPDGYIKNPVVIDVEVKVNDDGTLKTIIFEGYGENVIPKFKNILDIKDDVVIIKVDTSERPIGSVGFGLYNSEEPNNVPVDTQYSKEDGTVRFEDIAEGSYIIKEIETPAGYLKTEKLIYVRVDRTDDNNPKVEYSDDGDIYSSIVPKVVNTPINIVFNKVDNDNQPLEGAEFTLYNENDDVLKVYTSSADGKVIFTAVPAGTYIIKETKAPAGYKDYNGVIKAVVEVLEGAEVKVSFSKKDKPEDEEFAPVEELKIVNERKPTGGGGGTTPVYGKVTVKKVDEDKKVLSGAEFTLYDSKGKVVGKAVTGSDGTVSFEELEPGEYVLKETKAPEGYVLDEKETDVTISANKTNSYTITNRKEGPKKPGRIEIIKTDEEGKLLSDAWFSLIDEKGSTLQNAGTVNGRVAFEDVPVGRYTVKEVQAPEGYELSGKAVTVTVESNKTVELSFVNKKSGTPVVPANGRITINKVDENSNALAGAEFTLYDENNRIVETAVTDKDGKVVFESLKDGRYFVKETKAPEGYVLVNEAKIVDIAGGQTYSYKFKNVLESVLIEDPDVPMGWETIDEPDVPKGVGTLPNTGYILNTWMLAALGLLLIAEGIFLRKRRRMAN